MRDEHGLARAALAQAGPVMERRGSPARRSSFYVHLAWQRVIQNRMRVDEEDIANVRKALAAASQGDDEMVVGYAAQDLGILLLWHDDLAEAQANLERSLAIAERIGEAFMRARPTNLALSALRRHELEAVRCLASRAVPASEAVVFPEFVAQAIACLAWLAWQDGRPDDVLRLANEAEELLATAREWFPRLGWIAGWPLVAIHLDAGRVADGVATGRYMLDHSQQRLPDALESLLVAAGAAWQSGAPEVAREKLSEALRSANELNYF